MCYFSYQKYSWLRKIKCLNVYEKKNDFLLQQKQQKTFYEYFVHLYNLKKRNVYFRKCGKNNNNCTQQSKCDLCFKIMTVELQFMSTQSNS